MTSGLKKSLSIMSLKDSKTKLSNKSGEKPYIKWPSKLKVGSKMPKIRFLFKESIGFRSEGVKESSRFWFISRKLTRKSSIKQACNKVLRKVSRK